MNWILRIPYDSSHEQIKGRVAIKSLRRSSFLPVFLFLCLGFLGNAIAETVEYDIAADWSDDQNPNGVWTYAGNNGVLLGMNHFDWDVQGFFFAGQRAWANAAIPNPNHVPMWFKASGPSALDVPGVGMHGSEGAIDAWVGVIWRSPAEGHVSIEGGVWQALKTEIGAFGGTHRNRNADWRLRHNEATIASGNISGTDQYSSRTPFTFDAGAAGQSLNNISVATGDRIVLEFISPTSFAPFVGLRLAITVETD